MKNIIQASHLDNPIENLPSVRKLRKEVAVLSSVGVFLRKKEIREEVERINGELDRIVQIVNEFYRILGSRNWVYFDALSLDRISEVIAKSSPDETEREFIAYLKEEGMIGRMITQLNRFPDMRPRLDLLRKAERDFLEERYYSSLLVTVSIMDGFVNDAFKDERRGLHARRESEMWAEDCVAAVWEGLPSVQAAFTKSIRKRIDDPIFDVHRHALMHGMATNFDNDVIASKAWCMLFAVGDWVEAKTRSQQIPEKPLDPIEAFSKLMKLKERNVINRKKLSEWNSHTVDLDNPADGDVELIESCRAFFDAWVSKNYGRLGAFFPNYTDATSGAQAGEAREHYSPHPIKEYAIEKIERPAAAVAIVRARINSETNNWVASMRFVRIDGKNSVAEWEPGEWKITRYAVDPFRDTRGSCSDC